jgi:hypothetical protein
MSDTGKVRYSKTLELGNGQRFELSATSASAYFTTISRDVLKGLPIVVGPTVLNREQWLEMARECTKIAGLLAPKRYAIRAVSRNTELY